MVEQLTLETLVSPPRHVYRVSELIARIRELLEERFPSIFVEGEVSNSHKAASGHLYFDLIDERAKAVSKERVKLPCVFFRSANQFLRFQLVDGQNLICFGRLSIYPPKGEYRLIVERVEPKGLGALQLAFEQLKKRLASEGLFDEARKQPLPEWPDRVALITSPVGSVIHDMLQKLAGEFAIVVVPVKVEGEGASTEIAEAIDLCNRHRLADVLIVGRGGGSLEDLWAFNEERLARAIVRSRIPVVSAVGHEDNWTIADYVADRRAPTPSYAAQLLVEAKQNVTNHYQEAIQQLLDVMQGTLEEESDRLAQLEHHLRLLHPMTLLQRYTETAMHLGQRLIELTTHALESDRQRIVGLIHQLEALSPLAVLARGYSITFRLSAPRSTGQAGCLKRQVLTDAAAVQSGEAIETKLAKGSVISTVTKTTPHSE